MRESQFNRATMRGRFVATIVAVALGLLPVLVGPASAQAALASGPLCEELFSVTKPPPAFNELPGVAPGLETATAIDATYDYVNNAILLTGMAQPTTAELRAAGTDPSKWPPGSKNHAISRWGQYLQRKAGEGKPPLSWEKWLNQYIPNQGNANRGQAYEGFAANTIGLSGPDWQCQAQIPDAGEDRTFDAVNVRQKIAYEFKSGTTIDAAQLAKDSAIMQRTGFKVVYVFGQEPTKATLAKLDNAGVTVHRLQARPNVTTTAPPDADAESQILSPGKQTPSSGALTDLLERSGTNQAEALEAAAVYQEEAEASGVADAALLRPGGIDFSTMELRYVQDTGDGSGLQYDFNAADLPDGQVSFGGLQVAQLSSDSFFTWLALPPSAFWVNLNPAQPDRIIDPRLAKTDAGRVLLNADLTLKKTVANLIKPGTPLGDQFWDSLDQGPADQLAPCFAVRSWIVPAPATVRQNGGQLFILDAPLTVMSAPIGAEIPIGSGFDVCQQDPPDVVAHNQDLYRTLILPKLIDTVNKAPEFEDLRRVYLSRVAAEWIRERSAGRTTAFSTIINSGDVSRWPARVTWDPQEVFGRFLTSFNHGEYTVEHTFHQTGKAVSVLVSFGGVDFSSSPRSNLSPAAFQKAAPALPRTISASQTHAREDADGLHSWLGGSAAPARAAPPPPPPRTAPPTLAITGQPLAWEIAVGAGLALTGAALLVWQRRRRTMRF